MKNKGLKAFVSSLILGLALLINTSVPLAAAPSQDDGATPTDVAGHHAQELEAYADVDFDRQAERAYQDLLRRDPDFPSMETLAHFDFVGVLYDSLDLTRVQHRVYECRNGAGEGLVSFYIDVDSKELYLVEAANSAYSRLLEKLVLLESRPILDLRAQVFGIVETVFYRPEGEAQYYELSILADRTVATGCISYRALSERMRGSMDEYRRQRLEDIAAEAAKEPETFEGGGAKALPELRVPILSALR